MAFSQTPIPPHRNRFGLSFGSASTSGYVDEITGAVAQTLAVSDTGRERCTLSTKIEDNLKVDGEKPNQRAHPDVFTTCFPWHC